MSLAKYNARDLAKDFGMQAKAIAGILNEYTGETPSPTKILTDRELTIVFEALTQRNQVESIESIYADVYHEPAKKSAPEAPQGQAKGAQQGGQQQNAAPARADGQKAQKPAPGQNAAPRVPEKKVVDTRKGGQVNLEKYDQRLEDLAPEKADRMQTGKQKFQSRGGKNRGQSFGSKRRQEEAE